ncbi:hypothetical protein [Streptomyces sp. NPDC088736]|uniref:hypothetical protein n=1 Tax=Streptomyces sp. NPDC088736 TaxID=3365881 RepID=UPI0038225ADD
MAAKNIKPIETRYKGYRFRSRLEARWAVFMDHLDVDWEYEPQGYVVDGRPYLPDFLVWPDTELAFWLEIKGQFPGQDELDAARGLAEGTQIPAIVYWGKPQPPAPDLDYLTHDAYCGWDQEDGYIWADERGRLPYPTRPPAWQLDLTPTAFHFNKVNKASIESGFWWWTDCPFCGKALIKLHGQVGSCPSNAHLDLDYLMDKYGPPYPRFAHRTERLLQAYEAARSARFEHGENGA